LIADALGRRRDVSECVPIAEVFDELVASLAEDPGLLDPRAEDEASPASPAISVTAAELESGASCPPVSPADHRAPERLQAAKATGPRRQQHEHEYRLHPRTP
jgi:hypothetical protein